MSSNSVSSENAYRSRQPARPPLKGERKAKLAQGQAAATVDDKTTSAAEADNSSILVVGGGGLLLLGGLAAAAGGGGGAEPSTGDNTGTGTGNNSSGNGPVTTNAAPILSSIAPVSMDKGGTVTFVLDARDPDGDAISFSVSNPSNGTVSLSGSTLVYTPASAYSGTDQFVVTAKDARGLSASQTVGVTVKDTSTSKSQSVDGMNGTADFDAGSGVINFLDDVSKESDVVIRGFSSNDRITVIGATAAICGFGTSADDPRDLVITCRDTASGALNIISLDNVIQSGAAPIYDYQTAKTAVGFDFLTFG